MRILAIDTETTGLDINNDNIIELGYALYEWGVQAPLLTIGHFLIPRGAIPRESTEITGITNDNCQEFGTTQYEGFERLIEVVEKHRVDYYLAQNGLMFDKPMLEQNFIRNGLTLPERVWIDTKIDLPLKKPLKSMHLNYMAAEHGFLNPFPHRALFDAMTCAKILQQYDIDKVLESAKSPMIEIRAVVSYEERQLAKDAGYRWDGERKFWVKNLKEIYLEKERDNQNFQVQKLNQIAN